MIPNVQSLILNQMKVFFLFFKLGELSIAITISQLGILMSVNETFQVFLKNFAGPKLLGIFLLIFLLLFVAVQG